MKNLVLLLPWIEFLDVHLKKDTGLFPEFLAREYGLRYRIVFTDVSPRNTNVQAISDLGMIERIPASQRNLEVPPEIDRGFVQWIRFMVPYIKFVLRTRKSVSYFMMFHLNKNTLFLVMMIKLLNRRARVWVKADASNAAIMFLQSTLSQDKLLWSKIKHHIYKSIYHKIDMISVETVDVFSQMESILHDTRLSISLIPNGIEKAPQAPTSKEKIMITVARLGTYQKNTEFLLRCFEQIDLQDWKVYLIGSIEEGFQSKIEDFYHRYPHLCESIVFTGEIEDAGQINDCYSKSSVFLLPSRFEGFSLASIEAAMAGNYLIMSDVGSAQDLILNDGYGHILKESKEGSQNEEIMMQDCVSVLKNIVDGKVNIYENLEERIAYFNEHFTMENIIKQQCFQEWIG